MASQKPNEQDALGVFQTTNSRGQVMGAEATRHSNPRIGGASGAKGTASTPFSTSDGRPQGQDPTTPTSYRPPNRPQGEQDGRPSPVQPHMVSRPQVMGTAEQRVAPQSIPSDGITAPRLAPPYARGCGSVGNGRSPMKGMK